MEGSVVNQIEIRGFSDENDSASFRKKLKSLKSKFNLPSLDKSLSFSAEEASWKEKEDHSLVFLFITEDSNPGSEIAKMACLYPNLEIDHLVIAPSGCGEVILTHYKGESEEHQEFGSELAQMLGDLIQGGFQ